MQTDLNLIPYPVTGDIWMVPCHLHRTANKFEPICDPFSEKFEWSQVGSRHTWDAKEDEALLQITIKRGQKAWTAIATDLNNLVHKGLPIRQGKQCRERYFNHLNPDLNKGRWSNEEDLYVLKEHTKLGNRWSEISRNLQGRTENQIKNRFNSLVKKAKKVCPADTDIVAYLIKQKNGDNLAIPTAEKLKSPIIATCSRAKAEIGFSKIAERIKLKGTHCVPKQEGTPSPSTMLFFHSSS